MRPRIWPTPGDTPWAPPTIVHSEDHAANTANAVPHWSSPRPTSLRPSGWKRAATMRPAAMRPARKIDGRTGKSPAFQPFGSVGQIVDAQSYE
ncbi:MULTISPECIES: hypothetical protein [Streptomyces]|uniref:hypothetical protein n=1 Tax=Streptomyces TaxID=1883 RepID=UPI00345BCC47